LSTRTEFTGVEFRYKGYKPCSYVICPGVWWKDAFSDGLRERLVIHERRVDSKIEVGKGEERRKGRWSRICCSLMSPAYAVRRLLSIADA
jgi:hypothetical protein